MKFLSTGVNLTFSRAHGWSAAIDYWSDHFAMPECLEGNIRTRYFDKDLSTVIDRAINTAKAVGVTFIDQDGLRPSIYVPGDGEDPSIELPEEWREIVAAECERLGWENIYKDTIEDAPAAPAQSDRN